MASWFETRRLAALLTMRVSDLLLMRMRSLVTPFMVRSRAWRGISNHEAPEYADDTTRSWSLPGRIPL